MARCGSNLPVASDSMVGRKKEGPKFKQRADEVKNLAKDALTGMDKLAKVPEAVQAQILSRIPLGRFGKPEEIAHDADSAQRKCADGRSGLRRRCRGRGPGWNWYSLRVGPSFARIVGPASWRRISVLRQAIMWDRAIARNCSGRTIPVNRMNSRIAIWYMGRV